MTRSPRRRAIRSGGSHARLAYVAASGRAAARPGRARRRERRMVGGNGSSTVGGPAHPVRFLLLASLACALAGVVYARTQIVQPVHASWPAEDGGGAVGDCSASPAAGAGGGTLDTAVS